MRMVSSHILRSLSFLGETDHGVVRRPARSVASPSVGVPARAMMDSAAAVVGSVRVLDPTLVRREVIGTVPLVAAAGPVPAVTVRVQYT